MPRPNHSQNQSYQPRALPKPRTVTYFKDNQLAEELLDTEAEKVAQSLGNVKPTQLRRFYDDVMNLRQQLFIKQNEHQDSEEAFAILRADFKMLKAKAAYAHGRNDEMFPLAFLQFFIDHVASVKTAKDFEAFCKHFEAVVAFHKFYT